LPLDSKIGDNRCGKGHCYIPR